MKCEGELRADTNLGVANQIALENLSDLFRNAQAKSVAPWIHILASLIFCFEERTKQLIALYLCHPDTFVNNINLDGTFVLGPIILCSITSCKINKDVFAFSRKLNSVND